MVTRDLFAFVVWKSFMNFSSNWKPFLSTDILEPLKLLLRSEKKMANNFERSKKIVASSKIKRRKEWKRGVTWRQFEPVTWSAPSDDCIITVPVFLAWPTRCDWPSLNACTAFRHSRTPRIAAKPLINTCNCCVNKELHLLCDSIVFASLGVELISESYYLTVN